MTSQAARWLHPDVVVVVDLGWHGRGPTDVGQFDAEKVVRSFGVQLAADASRLLERCDVVYSAETWYGRRPRRPFTVLHSMPELTGDTASLVVYPTSWRVPDGGTVLPVPTSPDLVTAADSDANRPFTFVFQDATAWFDRAGGNLLAAALPLVDRPCQVVVRNPNRRWPDTVGPVHVRQAPESEHWWQWPAGDVFVAPRRYGGLSLPLQEAACLGMPAVVLDSDPYAAEPHTLPVPAAVVRQAGIGARTVDVHGCTPRALADAMRTLIDDGARLADLTAAAHRWAGEHAWPAQVEQWRHTLRLEAG